MKFNPKKEIVIGLYTAAAVVVLIFGLNFLKGVTFFKDYHTYHVMFKNTSGLSVSKPVYVSGFKIGRISQMKLKKSGDVFVTMEISRDYEIPKNSTAQLASVDILGNKSIIIIPGNAEELSLPGDTLFSDVQRGIAEKFEPIQKNAEIVLNNLDNFLVNINKTFNPTFRDNLSTTFSELAVTAANVANTSNMLSSRLENTLDKLDGTISNLEIASRNLKESSPDIKETIGNLKNVTTALKKAKLDSMVMALRNSANELSTMMEKINNSSGTIGKLVNDSTTIVKLNRTIESLDSLLTDLKRNPSRYVQVSVFGKKDKKK